MPRYNKKIQVLLTDDQFRDLVDIAEQNKKKLGVLVREAVEEYHLKEVNRLRISNAVDRLLALPEVQAPEDWEKYEKELAEAHGTHD
ncbi:MAG: hypothetical protein JW944_10630 [Deltaproteobacteria bacterium]|nr:hypothetical protein [Deltaproteobacteria bacterium]